MPNKAVFLDRDHTLIEDPGYISDPEVVKLLPGVELAVKSLAGAGYKLVVVTNQSGVARGMLTEEALEKIHAEMRRQLSDKDARVDAIYYCPYHPQGTVEQYAIDSDLRKPQPGMLLQAAKELDIDLSQSWMVGDSARDVEAGQRAGCRTVRVRRRDATKPYGEPADENVQADFTVRNLVDAARVILRSPKQADHVPSGLQYAAEQAAAGTVNGPADEMTDADVQRELLAHLRKLAGPEETFRTTKLIAVIAQGLTVIALGVVLTYLQAGRTETATVWGLIGVAMQVMSLTFYVMDRRK